tara:strand:+ start:632 stop:1042 length:411 start_codon:yes stop_codon:yes gene_type:complete
MNKTQKFKDLEVGKLGEHFALPLLNKFLKTNMIENDTYSLIDFEDENTLCELKTRRVRHNQYDSLYIPHYKLKYNATMNKQLYFAFNCTDGLYIFDYTKHGDKTYTSYGGRCDRGKNEYTKMINVPTNLLIKCNNE